MTAETLPSYPALAHEVPSLPELTSLEATYRMLCDESNTGSRRVGVINSDRIMDALHDVNTTYARTNRGELPAFVSIDYADGAGYDPECCREFLDDPDARVFYYTLPPLKEGAVTSIVVPDVKNGYIFFDHNEVDNITPCTLKDTLNTQGYTVEEFPLEDDQAAEGNKQASISLYGFESPVADFTQEVSVPKVIEMYRQKVTDGEYSADEDGARLLQGSEISGELLEKLWLIYKARFEWLGQNHPISMEDTKKQFSEVISLPSTVASIYFIGKEPQCFAYFTDEMKNIYWLNPNFILKDKVGLQPNEKALFWPGIVAKPDEVLSFGRPTIQLVTKVLTDMRAPYRIMFENTNRSEVYIPSLVERYIQGVGVTVKSTLYDRHYYRCYKITKTSAQIES